MKTECAARKFEGVCQILDKYDRDPGKLIPILQEVQGVYRYLPEQVLSFVATSLEVSPAKVYGVASFYAQLSLTPKGKHVIHICDGTACHVKGSMNIKAALDEKLGTSSEQNTTPDMMFTVETVSCLGACGLAPVITIDDKVHGQVTPEGALELVNDIQAKEQV